MQIITPVKRFLAAVQAVAAVVERKATIPVLSNILLETTDAGTVIVKGSDLDVELTSQFTAEASAGRICLNGHKLLEILRSLPDAELVLTAKDTEIQIRCERAKFKMLGLAAGNFPDIHEFTKRIGTMNAALLGKALARVQFCATTEESRYALNGALFEVKPANSGSRLRIVATDGHHMQLLERVEALTGEHSVLLPRKAMNAYQALAGLDEQGEVEIGIDPNHVYFRLGAHLLTTRLLSGQFPNYELVLPKSREITLRLQTWRLLPIIKRVLLMADSKSKSLRLEIKDKALHLSSEAADVGRGEDVLPLEIEAPPMVMGLNGKYLLDWLAGVETDELEILIKDEKSQIEGRPVGEQAWDSRYVLMPMRL